MVHPVAYPVDERHTLWYTRLMRHTWYIPPGYGRRTWYIPTRVWEEDLVYIPTRVWEVYHPGLYMPPVHSWVYLTSWCTPLMHAATLGSEQCREERPWAQP